MNYPYTEREREKHRVQSSGLIAVFWLECLLGFTQSIDCRPSVSRVCALIELILATVSTHVHGGSSPFMLN